MWKCVKNCGACCNLEPSDRPYLEEYLTNEELELYLSMVGEGGWCINFDRETRECLIYEQRPVFCRVKPDIFERMYGIEASEFDEFAIDCCHENIDSIYGEESQERKKYDQELGISENF